MICGAFPMNMGRIGLLQQELMKTHTTLQVMPLLLVKTIVNLKSEVTSSASVEMRYVQFQTNVHINRINVEPDTYIGTNIMMTNIFSRKDFYYKKSILNVMFTNK